MSSWEKPLDITKADCNYNLILLNHHIWCVIFFHISVGAMAWFGEKSWVPWIASLTTDISRCINLTHMIEFGFAFSNITNNLKKFLTRCIAGITLWRVCYDCLLFVGHKKRQSWMLQHFGPSNLSLPYFQLKVTFYYSLGILKDVKYKYTKSEDGELVRRKFVLLMYLLRSPCYDRYTK